MNRFKFQSITADDTLEFFLEYFPELKEKGVESIPGQHSTILAREQGCHFAAPHPPYDIWGYMISDMGQSHPYPPERLHIGLCVLLEMLLLPARLCQRRHSTGQLRSGPGLGTCRLSLIFFHPNPVPALHSGAVS